VTGLRITPPPVTFFDVTEVVAKRTWRGLAGVLAAQAASLSANRLLAIAVPWFVLTTTGSVARTGLVAFCQITPFVVVQALAGPLIDRVGPRRVSIAGDLVAMVAVAAVPVLYAAHALPLWALMVLMAVTGAADGPSSAAKSVFVPSATRAAGQPLERGTGLITAVERTATVIGPAMAGVLVAAYGGAQALWLAAALFGLAAGITALTLSDPVREQASAEGYVARLREGGRFLRQEPLLRAIIGMVIVTNLLDQAFLAVLLPVWARATGHGPQAVGLAVSVFGATSIVAAVTAAAVAGRLPRLPVYLVGFVVGGIPRFAAMALYLPLWSVLAVFAVSGLGSGFVNPIIGAVSYERIPASLLGRVRTLSAALSWSGIPFGGLFGAALVGLAGLTGALWVTGGLYLLAIVLPALRPEWSQMRATSRPPSEPLPG
jgi:MFS family permease